jgi:hypothetical protein
MVALDEQLPLSFVRDAKPEADLARLIAVLREHGWLTRDALGRLTGWPERYLRALAEAAPDQIVRGQKGFNLIELADETEILRAAEAQISQGKKMIRCGCRWKRLLHARVG